MTRNLSSLFADPTAANFTSVSLNRIFVFPDLGALIVRKTTGNILNLRRFRGGVTVAQMVPLGRHGIINSPTLRKGPGYEVEGNHLADHDGLEDGTNLQPVPRPRMFAALETARLLC